VGPAGSHHVASDFGGTLRDPSYGLLLGKISLENHPLVVV